MLTASMLTEGMVRRLTCGLLLGGDLHAGAEGAVAGLAEGPHLEDVGGAGLEVVDGGRGGLGPDGGVDPLLLVLETQRFNNGRKSRFARGSFVLGFICSF